MLRFFARRLKKKTFSRIDESVLTLCCWPIVLFAHDMLTLGWRGTPDRVQLKTIKLLELKDSQLQGRSSSRPLRGASFLRGRCCRRCSAIWRTASDYDVTASPLSWPCIGGAVLGAETTQATVSWELCLSMTMVHRGNATHGTYIKIFFETEANRRCRVSIN